MYALCSVRPSRASPSTVRAYGCRRLPDRRQTWLMTSRSAATLKRRKTANECTLLRPTENFAGSPQPARGLPTHAPEIWTRSSINPRTADNEHLCRRASRMAAHGRLASTEASTGRHLFTAQSVHIGLRGGQHSGTRLQWPANALGLGRGQHRDGSLHCCEPRQGDTTDARKCTTALPRENEGVAERRARTDRRRSPA